MSLEKIKTPLNESVPYTFAKAEGHESTFNIKDKKHLGHGSYGNTYRVTAMVGDKERNFVLKEFIPDYSTNSTFDDALLYAKQNANHSLNVHSELKKNGIATWTTYRIDTESGDKILMTDGESKDSLLMSTLNVTESAEKLKNKETVQKISNIENVISSAMEDAIKAAEAGISFNNTDIWFGRFISSTEDESTEMNFFVGDFDEIKYNQDESVVDLVSKNMQNALESFSLIIRQVVSKENAEKYIATAIEITKNIVTEYNKNLLKVID